MRFLLAPVFLLAASCVRLEGAPCTQEFWDKRPSWAGDYWTKTHTSDDTPCSSANDCPHSLHYCVEGRCRAWCDGSQREPGTAPECPEEETCAKTVADKSYPHASGICREMQGPDVYNSWSEVEPSSRELLGGVCMPPQTE